MSSHHDSLAVLLSVLTLVSLANAEDLSPSESFWIVGDVNASCGQFIPAVEGERKARPPFAPPHAVYTLDYQAFLSAAEGYLPGANEFDPKHRMVGRDTETQGRMQWLENYCRAKPLNRFRSALSALRGDWIKRVNH